MTCLASLITCILLKTSRPGVLFLPPGVFPDPSRVLSTLHSVSPAQPMTCQSTPTATCRTKGLQDCKH